MRLAISWKKSIFLLSGSPTILHYMGDVKWSNPGFPVWVSAAHQTQNRIFTQKYCLDTGQSVGISMFVVSQKAKTSQFGCIWMLFWNSAKINIFHVQVCPKTCIKWVLLKRKSRLFKCDCLTDCWKQHKKINRSMGSHTEIVQEDSHWSASIWRKMFMPRLGPRETRGCCYS